MRTARPRPDLRLHPSALSPVQSHHGFLPSVDAFTLEKLHLSQETADPATRGTAVAPVPVLHPGGHSSLAPPSRAPRQATAIWLQGLIYSCFQHPTPGEKPGVLSNFKNSLVSRLLADARSVLGGRSARDTLAALGKLLPLLRAAQSEAWLQRNDQPNEEPMLTTEILETLLKRASLVSAMGQAQDPLARFLDAAKDFAQELLTLPSLMELRGLLRRPKGIAGPLELMSEAPCSDKGPSSPGGLSLNWYDASQLSHFLEPELVSTLPDSSLSSACSELMGALDDHPLSHQTGGAGALTRRHLSSIRDASGNRVR
ncbi:ATP-binding cassette sub-family A member 7-like [Nannospalax galili]|uniref:ATP-binding cassette sub-family A member 7-like n=1 Tax=Nannospalax galili TaxID=1026970 RepID=UPI000819EB9A|nr:ATP-binding cassette sub-family A member 7-like [Nannospalax galili]